MSVEREILYRLSFLLMLYSKAFHFSDGWGLGKREAFIWWPWFVPFYDVDPACQHQRGLALVTQVCKSSSVALWFSARRALMDDKRPAEAPWTWHFSKGGVLHIQLQFIGSYINGGGSEASGDCTRGFRKAFEMSKFNLEIDFFGWCLVFTHHIQDMYQLHCRDRLN